MKNLRGCLQGTAYSWDACWSVCPSLTVQAEMLTDREHQGIFASQQLGWSLQTHDALLPWLRGKTTPLPLWKVLLWHRKDPNVRACVTCMLVRVLKTPLALSAVPLLQEERGSFHHEKALAQARRTKQGTVSDLERDRQVALPRGH